MRPPHPVDAASNIDLVKTLSPLESQVKLGLMERQAGQILDSTQAPCHISQSLGVDTDAISLSHHPQTMSISETLEVK